MGNPDVSSQSVKLQEEEVKRFLPAKETPVNDNHSKKQEALSESSTFFQTNLLRSADEAAATTHDNCNDRFSLKIKPEYVLSSRDTSLPPLIYVDSTSGVETRETSGGGRKKKRMRQQQVMDDSSSCTTVSALRICSTIVRGGTCVFGDKCKYPHDLSAYMIHRPRDIPDLVCPNYEQYGYCPYGVTCRLGSQHINQDGVSIRKEGAVEPSPVLNALPREVQEQLRRKSYPFVCQRHRVGLNKNMVPTIDNKSESNIQTAPVHSYPTVDSTIPLPATEIKLIDFSNKVYVAPLTTVGNLPFRRIMKKFGVDITCGEMALCSNLLEGKPSEWALLKRHPCEDVFGVQLAGGYADLFTRTCELLTSHTQVDFVDMNLGCPIDLICNKGSGACLMMREKRLEESVRGMVSALGNVPITIKMRTGWDLDHPFAHKLVNRINSWADVKHSIAAVMIHGRSRLQRYSRLADWSYIHHQVAHGQKSFPVIGNGDIFSYVDYETKVLSQQESSGLSTCAMIGRGALIKPWLATEIKERRHWDISATERLDILKDFVRFGLEHWGSDQQGVNNVRRFFLEWMSFLHRYVPIGLLEVVPQEMNHRAPTYLKGRNELETLFLSNHSSDWIRISEMLLGPVPVGFRFEAKHKAGG